jgi:hypothetical protein
MELRNVNTYLSNLIARKTNCKHNETMEKMKEGKN